MQKLTLLILIVAILLTSATALYAYNTFIRVKKPPPKPSYELVTIPELWCNLSRYLGKKVSVLGYFGHYKYFGMSNSSYLVLDYGFLTLDERLPLGSWIRLRGDMPSDYDGSLLLVTGTVRRYSDYHPDDSGLEVPLILVEGYEVVAKVNESGEVGDRVEWTQQPRIARGGRGVKACDRALIISGGVDVHNNHPRYRRNILEKIEKLKALGFGDDAITVLYYDGSSFTVDGKKVRVDGAATKRNIREVIERFTREMDPCCSLYIFVTDHGTGYSPNQPNIYSLPKLTRGGDPGISYRESQIVINAQGLKVYRNWIFETRTGSWIIKCFERKYGYLVVLFKWDDAAKKWRPHKLLKRSKLEVSERDLGVDIDGDGRLSTVYRRGDFAAMIYTADYPNLGLRIEWNTRTNRLIVKKWDASGRWKVIGEDRDGDNVIIGLDLDLDPSTDTVYTFHEGICLYGDEVLWDDELAKLLKPLHDKGVHIYVEMGQCFGGGFVENLKGIVDAIATAAAEETKAYATRDMWSHFEHFFVKNLRELSRRGWKEAYDDAVAETRAYQQLHFGRVLDRPQFGEAPSKPDLVVRSVSVEPCVSSSKVCAGEELRVTVTVRNVGWAASGEFRVRVDAAPSQGSGKVTAYGNAPSVEPGKGVKVVVRVELGNVGRYSITAVADSDNSVDEVFEDNNARSIKVEAVAPDLVVDEIEYTPSEVRKGATTKFTAKIRNIGPCTAREFKVKVQVLSEEGELTSAVLFDKEFTVKELKAGESTTVSFQYRFEFGGRFRVRVAVDPNNRVVELSEGNNDREIALDVAEAGQLDLSIAILPLGSVEANKPFWATMFINNTGDRAVFVPVRLIVKGPAQLPVYEKRIDVPPGGKEFAFYVTLPASGAYELTAIVDPDNEVVESDEENNVAMAIVYAVEAGPDLVVTRLRVKYAVYRGEDERYMVVVSANFTVANLGSEYVAGPIEVVVWLDDPENVIGSYTYPYGLKESGSFTYVLGLEARTTYGEHVVGVMIDPNNAIPELNEENNTISVKIKP